MKRIITILFICTFSGIAFSQNFGVNETSPGQQLDVKGWIKVGNQNEGSTATTGTIRYHTSGVLQYYNGSTWVSVRSRSAKFTRWGVNTCPSTSTRVYAGYAAGAHYTHTGSGTNTLCLTNAPVYAAFNDGNQNAALIYGTEYQASGYGVSTLVNRQDYDASCSVCLVAGASNALMIPGTVACPTGWTKQYWGYLMANHFTQQKSEFVCVDNSPQFSGNNADSNGNLWYPTEVEPGSLSGTTYVINRELTCVICTK